MKNEKIKNTLVLNLQLQLLKKKRTSKKHMESVHDNQIWGRSQTTFTTRVGGWVHEMSTLLIGLLSKSVNQSWWVKKG